MGQTLTTVEERIAKLEQEMVQLREIIDRKQPRAGWMKRLVGSHKNDAAFDEMDRLGREARQAEQMEYEE
ncbi:hypothetical protein [Rosistilla ulvae]|uniref:Uncharacterized protein n=1 Tax=Rosistilla ulvae TaxID=1930277 RepID=A0A517M499_9BACT|nr:hypothetical protein [Rosistilla ulvae]QDS89703.1 hypothetical protein EC9_39030 [Rosistilla ulvae]